MRVAIVILSSILIGLVRTDSVAKQFYPFKDAKFETAQGRIMNGNQAYDGQFPWQVYVIATNGTTTQFICGGSIISSEWILTAGHCVYHSLSLKIGYGTNIIHGASTTRSAYRTHIHPKYNPWNLNNDIALIKVNPGVVMTKKIQSVQLLAMSQTSNKFVNEIAMVSGWGRNADMTSPGTLQYTTVKVIANAACAKKFGSIVIESTLCASGVASKYHNICYGDSGGPLVVRSGGKFTQIGVVSFVAGAGCTIGYPSGYARVSSFRNWINELTAI